MYVVSDNMLFSVKAFLILLMSAFFAKNQHFLAKIVYTFNQSNSVRGVLEIFYFYFSFL